MNLGVLLILIALAWLTYPIAGAVSASADVAQGKRPKGAGFSFFSEWIVFPAAFVAVAMLVDLFVDPWGKWIVGVVCVLMIVIHLYLIARGVRKLRPRRVS